MTVAGWAYAVALLLMVGGICWVLSRLDDWLHEVEDDE